MRVHKSLVGAALFVLQSSLTIASSFTPDALITAPRPDSGFTVSPDERHYAVGVSRAHLDGRPTSSNVHVLPVPSAGAHEVDAWRSDGITLQGISFAEWLDNGHLVYVNDSALYTFALKDQTKHKIATLPAPIDDASLKVTGAPHNQKRLVFTAEVYEDGRLEGVKKVESEDDLEEWSRVKAYDGDNGALYRHWNKWNKPGKRSQLFAALISQDGDSNKWTLSKDGVTNLFKHHRFETPVAPFGGKDDYDVNEDGVIFNTKAVDLPEAWHTRTDVYHVSFADGKITKLSVQSNHGAISSPVFSPNGASVAWLQMSIDGFESDKRVLQLFDIASGEQQALLTEWDRSPSSLAFSHDSQRIFLVTEDHQRDKVYVVDVDCTEHASVPREAVVLEKGSVLSYTPLADGDRALLAASSLRHPSEVYIHSQHSNTAYPLTWFTGSKDSSLKNIEWKSADPVEFSYPAPDKPNENRWGWIHYPPGYEKRSDWPVAILIHGGPEGAWTDSWSTRWNPEVFAAAGYLVATLNPTGSTGFGQAYQEGILNSWGGEPFRDIIAGVHHVLKREKQRVNKDKVAAAGASYGGYMINWLQGHNDDGLFKALICHDGVFSTFSTFYSTEEHWFPEHEFGGSVPWNLTARSVYAKWSPENHVSNWKTPQLIIHGDKDFRLTPDQGISVFNSLRRRGVDTRLVYFENEGHWVLNPKSSRRWHHEVLGWLEKYIGGSGGGGRGESGFQSNAAADEFAPKVQAHAALRQGEQRQVPLMGQAA